MYIMYVDESGDVGLGQNSPKDFFALSGLIVHESRWRDLINALIQFRRTMRAAYNLPIRREVHASEYIRNQVGTLKRHERLAVLRNLLEEIAKLDYVSITNVIVNKRNKTSPYDVFGNAWKTLFQRFENTLAYGNFPGGFKKDNGIVITDATNGKELQRLVRKMAVYNHIPHSFNYGSGSRNVPITRIIEDPYGKDSRETLPIQVCDVCAYFLMQLYQPNAYIKRKGAQKYFHRLQPVLNLRARTGGQNHGIVEL